EAEAPSEAEAEAPTATDTSAEPESEAPRRRSWWRPAAAPVWPPDPADELSEESADQATDAAPVESEVPGESGVPVGASEAAAAPQIPAPPIAAEAGTGREPMPEWPAAESTQVLPPSWRAPRPDPAAAATPGELRPATAPVRTRLGTPESEPDAAADGEPEPSTAEQAVPWLIGVILLLAGMVIVLLALIFAGDASLGGGVVGPSPSDGSPGPSGSALAGPVTSQRPRASSTPSAAPAPSGDPTPTPAPIPEYGPLEMVYQGRSEPLAHIYLLHRDFTTEEPPEVLAQDQSLDVRQFAWAPDGTVGVAMYSDLLVSVEPGREKRPLGDEITTATFGPDATTVYAVRVTEDGDDDVATLLQIDFASGDATELASVTYARPEVGAEDPLPEAKFIDDGGPVRLFRLEDGTVRLWVLGAGAWDVDAGGGEAREVEEGALPTLWSPKGNRRVVAEEADGTTTLSLLGRSDEVLATTSVEGLVSHLRWSPKGDMVVFTVGTSASGGGVIQNLWVWYLEDGISPTQMTDTGAAFGAEWLGSPAVWRE
ncbi:MAG TPA: hypothetical protein VHQ42_01990, partial [Candidatus Limnocylindria bacterium]|nr:hypothetical protein [Candidatus Limnocylindria bacterium]